MIDKDFYDVEDNDADDDEVAYGERDWLLFWLFITM